MPKNILFTLPTFSLEQSKAPRIVEICKRLNRERFTPIASCDHEWRLDKRAVLQFQSINVPVEILRMQPRRDTILRSSIEMYKSIQKLSKKNIFIQHSSDYSSSWFEPIIAKLGGVHYWIATKTNTNLDGLNWAIRLNLADRIVVQTPIIKRLIQSKFPHLQQRVIVIPNGVDTNLFFPKPNTDYLKNLLGISKDDLLLGFIAHLVSVKDHPSAFWAISQSKVREKIHLLIVGQSTEQGYQQKLVELSRSLGLERQIHFLGLRNDVSDLLAYLDGVILTSKSRESLSNAVLQAMACGLPIIATNVGGMPDIVQHERNGWLIDRTSNLVNDLTFAIDDWASNPDKRSVFGMQSLKIVRDSYTVEKMVNGHLQLYESLL